MSQSPPQTPDPWTKQPGDYRTSRIARAWRRIASSQAVRNALEWLASSYLKFLHRSCRYTIEGGEHVLPLIEQKRGFVACFWHGRMQMIPGAWRNRAPATMLISAHRDGAFIAAVIARLGIPTIAGSTGKGGGEALIQMVRALRSGTIVAVTPDGPQGPRMRAAAGIVTAARLAGAPIVGVTYGTRFGFLASSWDRHLVPFPFARIIVKIGSPVLVPRDADAAEQERLRQLVEDRLNELTAACDRETGRDPVRPAPAAP
jgi:hypothetical protein